jgi:hypothetical protein
MIPDQLKNDLQTQWQGSNLLRIGTWGIGLILLIYAVLWLDEQLSLQQLDWRRQQAEMADLGALKQQGYWPALVEKLEQQKQSFGGNTWQAGTPGLAKAAVREFMTSSAAKSAFSIDLRQTEFAEPQPITGNVSEMRGRVNAQLEGSTVPWDWVAALESHTPDIMIDSLDIRVGRRSGVSLIIEFRTLVTGLGGGQ